MLGVRRPMREESLGYGVDKLYIRGLAKVLPSVPPQHRTVVSCTAMTPLYGFTHRVANEC